jgi:hypothetical protein
MTEKLGELISELAKTHIEQWHEEDNARCDDDRAVAKSKRIIDKLNQKRTDLIEKIDELIVKMAKAKKRNKKQVIRGL